MDGIFPELKSRRLFLQAGPVLGFGAFAWTDVAISQDSILKESDPEAATIEYRSEATQVEPSKCPKFASGQSCSN
jgi:hypothetical protein